MAPPLSRVHEAYRLRDGPYVADLVVSAARRRTAAVRRYRDVAREVVDDMRLERPNRHYVWWRDITRVNFESARERDGTIDIETLRRLMAATQIRIQMQRFVRNLWRSVRHKLYRRRVAQNYDDQASYLHETWRALIRAAYRRERGNMVYYNHPFSPGILRSIMIATKFRLQLQRFVNGLKRLVARARERAA